MSVLNMVWISIQLFLEPKVRLDCLEFLLHTCEQVEAIELEGSESCSPYLSGSIDEDENQDSTGDKAPTNLATGLKCSLFHYSEPLPKIGSQKDPHAKAHYISIRKNRNLICWSKLMRTTLRFFVISSLILASASGAMAYCILSVLITKQGFELL